MSVQVLISRTYLQAEIPPKISRFRICKRLRSPGIDSKESIPPVCSLAARYVKQGCRILACWKSNPGLLKRFINKGSGISCLGNYIYSFFNPWWARWAVTCSCATLNTPGDTECFLQFPSSLSLAGKEVEPGHLSKYIFVPKLSGMPHTVSISRAAQMAELDRIRWVTSYPPPPPTPSLKWF